MREASDFMTAHLAETNCRLAREKKLSRYLYELGNVYETTAAVPVFDLAKFG